MNLILYKINVNSNNINFLLINSINKYHPFIFYMSLITLFNILSIAINLFYTKGCFLFINLGWDTLWVKSVEFNLISIIITLFLGSW